MMKSPGPISCNVHDHLELACIRRYELSIRLRDGSTVTGRASTTRTGTDKIEYLVITSNEALHDVPMHEITDLRVLTPNADFQTLAFEDHCG